MIVRLVLGVLTLACALVAAPLARADEIRIDAAAIELGEDGYVINADFDLELKPRHEEALHNGLSLYFLVECELSRPRWYWFDERVVSRTLRLRLSFHALTRQYRLSTGALSQSFATLAEALRAITRLRNWQIAERNDLRVETEYDAYLRMRLDTSQLPKPFQVSVIGDRDWTLDSGWRRWKYTPPPPAERAR